MPDSRPNVLFLLSDQHHQQWVGHRDGRQNVSTPTIDRLAERGADFRNAYCAMPLCTPSRHTILTGQRVPNCGAWSNGSVVDPDAPTMAGTLSDAGYATGLVGKMHLGGDRQLGGFDERPYGDLLGLNGHQYEPVSPERRARNGYSDEDAGITELPESQLQESQVIQESVAWLREHRHANPDQPWFLCASLSRPHSPYTTPSRHFERYWPDGDISDPEIPHGGEENWSDHPMLPDAEDVPEPELARRVSAAYAACVDHLDEFLGDLVALLEREGFLENTVVVYASDHGDCCGEHGHWGKKSWLEGSVRVPITVQLPEHRSGELAPQSVETPVSLVDLFPTFCGLGDVAVPDDVDGTDLSDALLAGEEPERGPVVSDFAPWNAPEGGQYRVVVDWPYKYVRFRDAPELLFDLAADPRELTNLTAEDADQTDADEEALERLRAYVDRTVDFDEWERAREQKEEWESREHGLGANTGTMGNAYLLDDGRIVDADAVISKPDILIEEPAAMLDDFEEGSR